MYNEYDNLELIKSKVIVLIDELNKCDNIDDADVILDQLDEHSDNLVKMLNDQYRNIKKVDIGDTDGYKREIDKLFKIKDVLGII